MAIDYKRFGIIAKEKRMKMGLRQADVYKLTGVSAETLRLLEGGLREPRIITLERLSEVYRTDLLHVLQCCRVESDLFSVSLFEDLNDLLNNGKYEEFIERIDKLIVTIKSEYINDGNKKPNNMKFVDTLEKFKDITPHIFKYRHQNVIFLTQILNFFSTKGNNYLSDESLYFLEVQVGILLSVNLRQNGEFKKSETTIMKIINSLENEDYLTSRQMDYLMVAYYHLVYIYHRLDKFDDVIKVVDNLLRRSDTRFKRIQHSDLLLRKAVALYKLNNDNYKHLFATILMQENSTRAKLIYERALKLYDIDIASFVDMDLVIPFDSI